MKKVVALLIVSLSPLLLLVGAGCPEIKRASGSASIKRTVDLPKELTTKLPTTQPKVRIARQMLAGPTKWTSPFDANTDGYVDAYDYQMFVGCFNGTGNPVPSNCGYRFDQYNVLVRFEAGLAPKSFTVNVKQPDGTPYPLPGATVEMIIQMKTGRVVGSGSFGDSATVSGTLMFVQEL